MDDAELTSFVVEQAQRMGVTPDQLAVHLRDSGQIGSAVGDVLRAKALDLIVRRAAIKDGSGNDVDLAVLVASEQAADELAADEPGAAEDAADDLAAAEDARMCWPRMSGPRMFWPRMSGPRMSWPRMSGPRMSGPRMRAGPG